MMNVVKNQDSKQPTQPFVLFPKEGRPCDETIRCELMKYRGRVRVIPDRSTIPKRAKVEKGSIVWNILFGLPLIGEVVDSKWQQSSRSVVLKVKLSSHEIDEVCEFRIYPEDVLKYNRITRYKLNKHTDQDGMLFKLALLDFNHKFKKIWH